MKVMVKDVPSVRPYVYSMGYLECLKAYFEFLGEDFRQEAIWALSGDSFRFFFSQDDVDKGIWVYRYNPLRTTCDLLGYDYEYHHGEPYEIAWKNVTAVLRKGRPVMVLLHPSSPGKPIAALVVGFDTKKLVIYCNSIDGDHIAYPINEFQSMWSDTYSLEEENKVYPMSNYFGLRKTGGPMNTSHPYFFIKKSKKGWRYWKPSSRLQRNLVLWEATRGYPRRKRSRGCASGFSAYEELAASFEKVEVDYATYSDEELDLLKFSEEQLEGWGGWNGAPLLLLQGSRQAASDYLIAMAEDDSEFDYQASMRIEEETSGTRDIVPRCTPDLIKDAQFMGWWNSRRQHVRNAAALYGEIVRLLDGLKFASPTSSDLSPRRDKLNSADPILRRKALRGLATDIKGAAEMIREILGKERSAWSEINAVIEESWPPMLEWHWSNVQPAEVFRSSLVQFLELHAGARVLDVGCGSGFIARSIRKTCECEVIGIDMREGAVRYARELARKEGVDVRFQWGHGEELEFEDNSFDVVMSTNSPQFYDVLKEMIRVTKEGGLVVTNGRIFSWDYSDAIKHYPPFLASHKITQIYGIDNILFKIGRPDYKKVPITGELQVLLESLLPAFFYGNNLVDIQMMSHLRGGFLKDIDRRTVEEKVQQLHKDLEWIEEQKKDLKKPLRLPKDGLTQKERKKLLDFEEERVRYLLEDPERLKEDMAIHMGIEVFVKGRKPMSRQ